MRRSLVVVTSLFALLLLAIPDAEGCGDKLLLFGRSARMRAAIRPASILAYAQPGSPTAALLQDPQWLVAVKKGQYRVQRVENISQIGQVLRNSRFDLIVGQLSEAPQVQDATRSLPATPLLVPVVQDKDEIHVAQRQYKCLLKAHAKSGAYLSAIEDALDLKATADQARERARSPHNKS